MEEILEFLGKRIEDKLHGIAVQLGILNEKIAWLKAVIEEERATERQQAATKDPAAGIRPK